MSRSTASDDGSAVNDASIVLLGSFEGRRFLLTGDAEAVVEAELVSRGLPTVDLLKVGHHGSRTSTTEELVAAARPRVAVVSVGAGNDYGHPSRDVLARLADAGAAVLRTDQVRDDRRDARCRRHRGSDRAPGTARRGRGVPDGATPGRRPGGRRAGRAPV